MGVVYLAEHLLLGGHGALKFLAPELSRDPQFVKRFRNEARAAYQLRHPNIVEVTDLDQDEDGSLFIAMEYVSGPSLRSVLHDSKELLPVPRVLAIASGVAAGLGAAHARGAVHRDIKPDNILLAAAPDGSEIAKVLDFGIAVMTDGVTHLSRTHGVLLTPQYAAPEQWRGLPAAELDGRTDLYALGGVLYEMLAGRTPFQAANMEGWMYEHLQGVPEPLEKLRPDLATNYPGLAAITMQLLAREREQRFPSAATLVEALALKSSAPSSPAFVEPAPARVTAKVSAQPRLRIAKWAVPAALLVACLGIWFGRQFIPPRTATAVPVLIPIGGTYPATQSVAISDPTPNATIHFTVDGSAPTPASPVYAQPLTSLPSGSIVRAMAIASGHKPSSDATGVYIWSGAARSPESTSPYATTKDGADLARKLTDVKAAGQKAPSIELNAAREARLKVEQGGESQPDSPPQTEPEGVTWTDPSTGLMWTRMDNGKDLTWQEAMQFCQNLPFVGHTDWRLPTIGELQGIYESRVKIPGQCCNGLKVTWHVKGNLQLSGYHWSSSKGNGSGQALSFNFYGGVGYASPVTQLGGERALCVRRAGACLFVRCAQGRRRPHLPVCPPSAATAALCSSR
jgi:serine/threonine-protein kinase